MVGIKPNWRVYVQSKGIIDLSRLYQSSGKTDSVEYIDIYKRRFIIGIRSCKYGSQKVPQSAAHWKTSKPGGVIQSKSKGLRTRELITSVPV